MTTLLIANGHLIDPKNGIDAPMDLLIREGKVIEVSKNIPASSADKILDAQGKYIFPGLIDLQVHLREPGREDRETIETGLRAAINGGITSVVSMPNLNPVADNQAVIAYQLKRAKELQLANLYPTAAISKGQKGKELSEMRETKLAGALAVTDDGVDVQSPGILQKGMEWAKTFDLLLMSHCEEESLHDDGVMHEGKISTEMGLSGISAEVEDLAVLKNVLLAQKTGCRFHALHCSTARGLDFLRQTKKDTLTISAETCPQYFALTDEICKNYNTMGKMYPPIRSKEHQKAVIAALKDGTIDAISTDHAPHLLSEKMNSFDDAVYGSVGLETSLALSYTHLVQAGHLTLSELVEKMSVNPARILGIDRGDLSIGSIADITLFDAKSSWTIDSKNFESKGRNCVFEGMTVIGKATDVLVAGILKKQKGKVLSS